MSEQTSFIHPFHEISIKFGQYLSISNVFKSIKMKYDTCKHISFNMKANTFLKLRNWKKVNTSPSIWNIIKLYYETAWDMVVASQLGVFPLFQSKDVKNYRWGHTPKSNHWLGKGHHFQPSSGQGIYGANIEAFPLTPIKSSSDCQNWFWRRILDLKEL